jgi:hypothetical protein
MSSPSPSALQGASAEPPFERTVALESGTLRLRVSRADLPLDELCGFASRRNRKRGFLFVSKVLGRHIPVRPGLMSQVHDSLARQIPRDLPGPVLFVGLAETAVALGHGVRDRFAAQTGRTDTFFLHTSRYRLNRPVLVEFLEEHSHAPSHILYQPSAPELLHSLKNARSLVLVDDEASTGKTFINLTRALTPTMTTLERVVTAVITDWRAPHLRAAFRESMPVDASTAALLEGEYQFEAGAFGEGEDAPAAIGTNAPVDALLGRNYGRLGVTECPELPLPDLGPVAGRRILVLGSSEFVYPPFLLAGALERLGATAFCQATTRSPVRQGGAVSCVLEFKDNYADGINNYLYNARREDYDRILICTETPAALLDPALVEALGAQVVQG